jgi:hypothetical protein
MARTTLHPRKRRTRQHVIADQSVNLVERYVIDEGHTAQAAWVLGGSGSTACVPLRGRAP